MYVLRAMCLCLAVNVVYSDNSSKISKKITSEMFDSCYVESKMSEDELWTLQMDMPQTQCQICFVGCIYRKINVISNGKYSEEAPSVIAHLNWQNQTDANQAKIIYEVCANRAQSAGTDECTLAGVFLTCSKEEIQKAGLPLRSKSNVTTKFTGSTQHSGKNSI